MMMRTGQEPGASALLHRRGQAGDPVGFPPCRVRGESCDGADKLGGVTQWRARLDAILRVSLRKVQRGAAMQSGEAVMLRRCWFHSPLNAASTG